MPKSKINFTRILCTGFIWTILYFTVMDTFGCHVLNFSPLSLSDWGKRIGDWLNSRWVITTGKDWMILFILIGFWPIYIIGWRKFYRFNWGRIKPRCFRKKVIPVKSSGAEPVKKNFGPQKLRVQTSALLSVPAADAQTPIAPSTGGNAAGGTPPMGDQNPVPNRPPIPQYEDEAEVQQMLAQTANVQADFFPHVLLDGKYASFAMSTEKLAAVVRIINRPESTFAVDTEVDINSSDWFYESGLIQAPAKDIIAISQNLQANEPDSVATSVILLMGGQLLNVEETLAYFEKNNIMLLRTESVDIPEIPLVGDFMHDYFGLRSEGA
ncbi:MAG: hypothetical protein IKS41_05295 [Alphaproteobacteria bacterium]|nr:hypothetical protein [Alphaproteobacteria bacterium]